MIAVSSFRSVAVRNIEHNLRFEIKDLLLITLIAAIAAVAWRSSQRSSELQGMISNTKVNMQTFERQTLSIEASLVDSNTKLDFFAEVAKAYEPALEGFAGIQQRYGVVEPRADKVSIRSVPTIRESNREARYHYRISVPDQIPVFLRSAFTMKGTVPSSDRTKLDEQAWLKTSELSESTKSQMQIQPGIHDLHVRIQMFANELGNAAIELELDGQLLTSCVAKTQTRRIGSWSNSSLTSQYDFVFKRGTQYLMKIDVDEEEDPDQRDLEFWIWLSGDKDVKFDDYPRLKVGGSDEQIPVE